MFRYMNLLTIVLVAANAAENYLIPNEGPQSIQTLMNLQNSYRRSLIGKQPELIWSDKLASIAEKTAIKCEQKEFRPESVKKNNPGSTSFGENSLFGGDSFNSSPEIKFLTIATYTLQQWYYQSFNYQYIPNKCTISSLPCQEYTQMIWSKTQNVGCALARCPNQGYKNAGWYFVCEYYPIGNIVGQRPY